MSHSKRILFLYCGGTIGLKPVAHGNEVVLTAPKDDTDFKEACEPIISKLNKEAGVEVVFEMLTTKDSTNMTPDDWTMMVERVCKAQDEEGYDAVGLAHGTDTLAYTACAMALGLHGSELGKSGLRIPVCLTGAQNTVYEQGGDGRFNLENLFRTLNEAIKKEYADVFINFWNRVFLGCRALKTSEKQFDAFKTPAFPQVGEINSHGVFFRKDITRKKSNASSSINLASKFGNGIIGIELSPGVLPANIDNFVNSGEVNAIVFKSLGEGNVCTEGRYNLLPSIENATKKGVPILITTKYVGGSAIATHYEVGMKAIQAGGIPCLDQTDVAVDVKTRWLIGNNICEDANSFTKAMATSYAGEVSEL